MECCRVWVFNRRPEHSSVLNKLASPIKKTWFLRKSEALRDNLKAFMSFINPLFLFGATGSLKTWQHVSAPQVFIRAAWTYFLSQQQILKKKTEETLIFTKKPKPPEINNSGCLIIYVLLSLNTKYRSDISVNSIPSAYWVKLHWWRSTRLPPKREQRDTAGKAV